MEITKKELANALHDLGEWPLNDATVPPWRRFKWSEHFAADVISKIGQQRQIEAAKEADRTAERVITALSDDTKVTRRELIESYRRTGNGSPQGAVNTVNDIVLHREPEWQPGDLARGNDGVVVERTKDGEWKLPGKGDNVFTRYIPKQPLKLLKEV
jgi:hypothetical protein